MILEDVIEGGSFWECDICEELFRQYIDEELNPVCDSCPSCRARPDYWSLVDFLVDATEIEAQALRFTLNFY